MTDINLSFLTILFTSPVLGFRLEKNYLTVTAVTGNEYSRASLVFSHLLDFKFYLLINPGETYCNQSLQNILIYVSTYKRLRTHTHSLSLPLTHANTLTLFLSISHIKTHAHTEVNITK